MPDTNEEAAVRQVLSGYYKAFSTLEVQAVLPYFHEPSMLMAHQGVYSALTRDLLTNIFSAAMEDLRARGYGRSELSLRQLMLLGATAAMATGVALRYKVDGEELDRAGVTYLLYRSDAGWKIAVLVIQDPPAES